MICGDSSLVERPALPVGGGSIPISPLQLCKRDWWVAGCDQRIAEDIVTEYHYARGHTGAIYLAAGWEYCGETKPEAVYTINGRMTARKAGGKTRTHAEMLALGAVCHGRFAKSRFALRAACSVTMDGGSVI